MRAFSSIALQDVQQPALISVLSSTFDCQFCCRCAFIITLHTLLKASQSSLSFLDCPNGHGYRQRVAASRSRRKFLRSDSKVVIFLSNLAFSKGRVLPGCYVLWEVQYAVSSIEPSSMVRLPNWLLLDWLVAAYAAGWFSEVTAHGMNNHIYCHLSANSLIRFPLAQLVHYAAPVRRSPGRWWTATALLNIHSTQHRGRTEDNADIPTVHSIYHRLLCLLLTLLNKAYLIGPRIWCLLPAYAWFPNRHWSLTEHKYLNQKTSCGAAVRRTLVIVVSILGSDLPCYRWSE